MDNYWNKRFQNEKLMWGAEPSNVAVACEKIFRENNVKHILIMGAVDHTTENIETDERQEEYNMIYGVYKIRK